MHKVVAPCIAMRGEVDAIAARLEKFRKVVSTAEEPLEDPTWKDKMWQSMDSADQSATTISWAWKRNVIYPTPPGPNKQGATWACWGDLGHGRARLFRLFKAWKT